MSKQYRMERTKPDEVWDDFVSKSTDGTIFSLSAYLNALNVQTELYYCFNKQELRAAIALVVNEDGSCAILDDFIIYNGLIFGPPTNLQNRAQRLSEKHLISDFVAKWLVEQYHSVNISLAPSIVDIRAWLWVNYHAEGPKYSPDIRYTSFADIGDFKDVEKTEDTKLFEASSKSRRQEIRYAARNGVITDAEFDAKAFVRFYYKTMSRQNVHVPNDRLETMEHLIQGVFDCGIGRMFISRDRKGIPGSMAFFGIDNKRAYYLFGANDPSMRSSHTGTAVLWDAFQHLSRDGVSEVDMEGVNSPKRGWFKLSFGGDIRPYYELGTNSAQLDNF